MIDCSHANSGKDHARQPAVADATSQASSRDGSRAIMGVMLESFLVDGSQNHETAPAARLRPEHHRQVHELGAHGAAVHQLAEGRAQAQRGR